MYSHLYTVLKTNTEIPPPIEAPPPKIGAPKYPMMETRMFKDQEVYTTVLPKGTLLFRGVFSSRDRKTDLYGLRDPYDRGKYTLSEQYEVFFYPFPFIDQTVDSGYDVVITYVLTHDVRIACLISPTPHIRADKSESGRNRALTTCDQVVMDGRAYDPCFQTEFVRENPDVLGMIAIANADRDRLHYWFKTKGVVEFVSQYASLYEDNSKNGKIGGIPEIILYPLNGRRHNVRLDVPSSPIEELKFRGDNCIYSEYHVMFGKSSSVDFTKYINDLLSEGGYNTGTRVLRAQIDKTTGFYVDPSLYSGNPSNLLLPSQRSQLFPETRFVHFKPRLKPKKGIRKLLGFGRHTTSRNSRSSRKTFRRR